MSSGGHIPLKYYLVVPCLESIDPDPAKSMALVR